MNKKDLILLMLIVTSFTVILGISLKRNQSQIFPILKSTGISINTSHEGIDTGFSDSEYYFDKDSSAINFKYKLAPGLAEPITAIYFHKPNTPNHYFDFSGFNEITLNFSSKKGKRIPVYLTIDYEKLKTKQKELLSMPLLQVIDYNGPGTYKLNKADFEIPSWWLRYHGLKKETIGQIDFSKVNYILLNSCQTLGPDVEDIISIKSVAFTQNNLSLYIYYCIALAITLIGFTIKYFFTKRKKVLVPYRMNDIQQNPNGTKIERILHFIGQNYDNPELSVTDIQIALGITTREIGNLIKDELGVSFKAYLNTIRLLEIKRLLKETDLPVSDIAYKMGYNNISHFNRVFKKELGVSPKEFRETI